jgi:hypothetical protein
MVKVNLVIMGQGRQTIEVPEGTSMETLKEMVELNPSLELRISGETVDNDYVVSQGDNIIATLPVKGGR